MGFSPGVAYAATGPTYGSRREKKSCSAYCCILEYDPVLLILGCWPVADLVDVWWPQKHRNGVKRGLGIPTTRLQGLPSPHSDVPGARRRQDLPVSRQLPVAL